MHPRKWLRRLFKPKPIRLPSTYPWSRPPVPLPFGTILIDETPGSAFRCIADGKGGITTLYVGPKGPRATPRRTG